MEGSVGRIKKSRACAGFALLVFRLYGLKLASYKTLILKPLGVRKRILKNGEANAKNRARGTVEMIIPQGG